jgi:hypothetical protein
MGDQQLTLEQKIAALKARVCKADGSFRQNAKPADIQRLENLMKQAGLNVDPEDLDTDDETDVDEKAPEAPPANVKKPTAKKADARTALEVELSRYVRANGGFRKGLDQAQKDRAGAIAKQLGIMIPERREIPRKKKDKK